MAKAAAGTQSLTSLKRELVDGAALVASIGLVPLTQGNLSLRDPESGLIPRPSAAAAAQDRQSEQQCRARR